MSAVLSKGYVGGYNVLGGDPSSNKIQEAIWRKVDGSGSQPSPMAIITTPSLLMDNLSGKLRTTSGS